MGKIKDLFYKVTRGSEALKPNDLGPAKKLNLAAIQERVPVKIEVVPATVGTNPGCACGGSCACGGKKKTVTDAELKAHLKGEGLIADDYVAEVKKQAVKKAPAKKPAAKKRTGPGSDRAE